MCASSVAKDIVCAIEDMRAHLMYTLYQNNMNPSKRNRNNVFGRSDVRAATISWNMLISVAWPGVCSGNKTVRNFSFINLKSKWCIKLEVGCNSSRAVADGTDWNTLGISRRRSSFVLYYYSITFLKCNPGLVIVLCIVYILQRKNAKTNRLFSVVACVGW